MTDDHGQLGNAFVTLLYNDEYLPGALVVAHALRNNGSTVQRAVLVTQDVSESARQELAKVYNHIIPVEPLTAACHSFGFHLLGRPELDKSYTKIQVWNQTQFTKVVFLDADTLPVKNIDQLFDHLDPQQPDNIAASPDIGWPDIFNSGVFVACPNVNTFKALTQRAAEDPSGANSFDGGDQGLLNQYFEGRWHRIPFTYNVTPSTSYQYVPAYTYFQNRVSLVHFIGSTKPWQGETPGNREFVYKWRQIYRDNYGERLPLVKSWAPDITATAFVGIVPPRYSEDVGHAAKQPELEPEEPKQDQQPIIVPASQPVFVAEPVDESKLILPEADRWDATKFVPPIDSKPEASELHVTYYDNAWDTGKDQQQFQYPQLGEPTVELWETKQPTVERVFAEDFPPVYEPPPPTPPPTIPTPPPPPPDHHDMPVVKWDDQTVDHHNFHFPVLGESTTSTREAEPHLAERQFPEQLPELGAEIPLEPIEHDVLPIESVKAERVFPGDSLVRGPTPPHTPKAAKPTMTARPPTAVIRPREESITSVTGGRFKHSNVWDTIPAISQYVSHYISRRPSRASLLDEGVRRRKPDHDYEEEDDEEDDDDEQIDDDQHEDEEEDDVEEEPWDPARKLDELARISTTFVQKEIERQEATASRVKSEGPQEQSTRHRHHHGHRGHRDMHQESETTPIPHKQPNLKPILKPTKRDPQY
jgi:lipopolysaccharide biosynthesis glycosyltransferase